MSFKLLFLAAAGAALVGGMPVRAQAATDPQDAPAPQAATAPQAAPAQPASPAEQAADRAVAEARAEVLAEARDQAASGTEAGEVRAVTVTDVREGSAVHDTQGALVGTVESVDETGAVVSTGRARAKLPFSSFGRNGRGLVISMTRAQLEAEVEARTAT